MEVIQKIKIDLLKPGVKPVVNVMQADENSRVIEIALYANGVAWEIPAGASFSIAYKKPDGTRGLYDTLPDGSSASSVDGNVVSIRLAPQMLTVPGEVESSVVIYSGEQAISTFPVIVNVIQNPAVGAVGSEDYFYNSVVGNLDDLKTTDKSSVVAAINEIYSTGGSGSDSGQNGNGLSTTAANLLITILRNGVYSTDQSANITALEAALSSGGSETPEPPASDVEQTGTILSIVSGVTVSQSGSVLAIA